MFEDTLEKPWHTRVFGPIEDVATAEYLAGGLGFAFIAVGALACISAITFGRATLVVGLVQGALGFLVWRIKSRAAASVLLVFRAFVIAVCLTGFALHSSYLSRLLWAIVLLGASIRAVQATFAYHQLRQAARPKEGTVLTLN